MEAEGKNERVFRGPEKNFFLQWGNRKRLRCVKVRDNNNNNNNNTPAVGATGVLDNNNNTQKMRTASRVNRRVFNVDKDRLHHPSSSPNRILREWESWGSESRKSSQPSSPDKEENRVYSTRGSTAAAAVPHSAPADNKNGNGNGHIGGGGEEKLGKVGLPRFFISLSSKEKEEDFMAMKGCKLPQRPKKRAKLIQRTILLVSPGAWLSDLSQERYEVREKKSSRKRKRGLKAISMESDSE